MGWHGIASDGMGCQGMAWMAWYGIGWHLWLGMASDGIGGIRWREMAWDGIGWHWMALDGMVLHRLASVAWDGMVLHRMASVA